MIIIGINWEQNSTAALFVDNKLRGVVSQERFSRTKNDERYPKEAIDWLLESNGIKTDDVDKVVFVSQLWSPGYILTRHYTQFSVKDYIDEQYKIWKPRIYEDQNVSQLDVYSKRLDLNQYPGAAFWEDVVSKLKGDSAHVSSKNSVNTAQLRKDVVRHHLNANAENIIFADHSSSHGAYAYFTAPKECRKDKTLVLTLDAFGDNINYTCSVYEKNSSNEKLSITPVAKGDSFIIGRLYRYITLILGLKPNEHEYKVMGMAPYCKPEYSAKLVESFKEIQDVQGLNFVYRDKPKDLYFAIRAMLEGERFDTICGALQAYTEYLVSEWIKNIVRETKIPNIVLAGGVGMNVKMNMVIARLEEVDTYYVPACPDDSSQAIGAPLSWLAKNESASSLFQTHTLYQGQQAVINPNDESTQLTGVITNKLKANNIEFEIKPYNRDEVAKYISKGLIAARCCGEEEFGARALGNRSILADPRTLGVKKKINENVKNRDFWMPFACSVLDKYASDYFILDSKISCYKTMTLCCRTTEIGRSELAAAIHPYDETCRPQIVSEKDNPEYYALIKSFGDLTGVFGMLNTSLNFHGSPIVSNLEQAAEVFTKTKLDMLVTDNYYVIKI